MKIPYHIECILKKKKITDLLESRSIFPAKNLGNKLVYRCPLHQGDNEPSFTVYLDSEFQNYFCYGCKKGGNVINLLSALDGTPIRKSVSNLIKGIDINELDVINSLIVALENGSIVDNNDDIEILSFRLNRFCYNYLSNVNFDQREVEFIDTIFRKVDKLIRARDLDTLMMVENFIEFKGLPYRMKQYLRNKEESFLNDVIA